MRLIHEPKRPIVPEVEQNPEQGSEQQVLQGEQTEQQQSTPPWGEDFNPQRAWETIQTQRQSESELKQQLQEAKQVKDLWEAAQNDPELQAQILGLWGYNIENQEPGNEDEPVFQDPRVDKLLAEQESQREAQLLTQHLNELAQKEGIELAPKQLERVFKDAVDAGMASPFGVSPQVTEQIFKQFVEDRKAEEQAIIDRYVKSKKAPRPASSGVPGSEKIDFSNEDERLKAFAATLESLSNDT